MRDFSKWRVLMIVNLHRTDTEQIRGGLWFVDFYDASNLFEEVNHMELKFETPGSRTSLSTSKRTESTLSFAHLSDQCRSDASAGWTTRSQSLQFRRSTQPSFQP